MQPRLWECVERQPGLAAVLFDWRQLLGEDYKWVEHYLRPTDRKALNIPCRVGCTPWCRRRVVRHGPDHIVAICDEGDPKYAVDETDLISHELNLGAVCRDLCGALVLEPAFEQVAGLHQTWQCGFLKSRQGIRHPVFLSIQMEEHHLVEVALRLCAVNRTPQVLLLPTTRRMSEPARHVLESNQTAWLPLDRTVGWSAEGRMMADVNLAEMLVPGETAESATEPTTAAVAVGGKIMIERRELEGGVHWIVGGVDKGKLYTRSDTKKAKILDTLYDLIGRDWVPHPTFIALTGWPANAYYSSSSEPGLMQRQLSDLRRKLGVAIEFKKDEGVRFAANIIRSH